MDNSHRFHTDETWLWVRAEHLVLSIILSILTLQHRADVAWDRFVVAFVLIDLVGYIPGAIAYRRANGGVIAPLYHHLYNVTHSYLTAGIVCGMWTLLAGAPEWAMLAIPIHLSGDRGLFGNTYKPTSLPFEPFTITQTITNPAALVHKDAK
ncbi:MAG: hypothetical protein FJ147_04330 [Deltaproteobacteria bacterium]|nr:hypothetical protein [Deltaproteobacteria bacterium]